MKRAGPKALLAGVSLASVLAGCAQVDPEAAFVDIETLVADRGVPAPRWRTRPEDDAAVAEVLATLLSRELTAESAVEIALLNNRSLQAAFEDLGIAQAEVIQASRAENPVLVGAPRFSDRSGTNLDLGITQNLLQLLVRPARKRLAGAQLEETRLRIADEILRLAAETQKAYFGVAGAGHVRTMRALVVDAARSSYALALRIHEAGNLSDLELAHERALFEDARVALAHSEVEVRAARETLTRWLGLWGADAAWTVAERLPDLPAGEPPLAALESAAIARRLDLAAEIQAVEVAATALGITRDWRYLLVAEIGVSAERETEGEWLVGPELALELPIFDQRQAEIAAHKARLRQRMARMTALAVEIRSEVRTLRDRLLMTRDLVEHYREVVIPLREQIVSLTEKEYNYMLVGAFDLLRAKESEYDAYRDSLEALRDYWTTRVELQLAAGGSLELPAGRDAVETPAAAPVDRPAGEPDHRTGHHNHGVHR